MCADVTEEPAAVVITAIEVGSQDGTAVLCWMSSLSSADVCMHLGHEVLVRERVLR